MKVIKTIILGLMLIFGTILYAQSKAVKENIDGIYHISITNGGLKNKVMQLVDSNGTEMLLFADCEKCFPAYLVYDKDSTEALGKPVFTFRGFFLVTYDNESFVSFRMPYNEAEDFSEINFYSKSKVKAELMTKEKMEAYVSSY